MKPQESKRERQYLHAHRLLIRVGLSLGMTFAWVFVFQYFLVASGSLPLSFLGTILVYATSQAVMMLMTPLSAAHLRRGMHGAMVLGACLCAAAFVVLGGTFAGNFSSPMGWGIVLFGILLGAYRALYWIPYRPHAASAAQGPNALYEILIALMPAFAGIALATVPLGPLRLLFGAAALVLLSIVPIFALENHG